MRKKSLFFILVLTFASFIPTSCKKDTIQYDFDGTITSSLIDAPISGVSVRISQKIVTNGITSEGYDLAGSATTSAAGQFNISFDREMVTEFLFEFEKEDYFDLDIIETSANVTTAEVNSLNEKLEPKSWITFDIENTFPNEMDHFKLITQTLREGCPECGENRTFDFMGENDTSFTYATTGGQYVKFIYINVVEGWSQTDSVYATPFETVVYEIIY